MEKGLRVVDGFPQADPHLDLACQALVRRQHVHLAPCDRRADHPTGLRGIAREDNSMAARIGEMELQTARKRILERADLNAFISVSSEEGAGTVVAVKDLVDVAGMVTTAGSVILPREPATEDAPVVRRLRTQGCVIVGKANLHEFAYGVTSVNPHYGAVRNPHDPGRVAGGSSGGSRVAVAAGMCDWAIGSDTGGSIRIPASFLGGGGFKPAFGRVERGGVLPLSWS